MKSSSASTRRRVRLHQGIEPLEARIAPASVVSVNAGSLQVRDNVNGVDNIFFSISSTNFRFVDSNGLTAGSGANQINANTVDVPMSTISGSISILTQGNNDTVTLTGAISTPGDLIIDTGTGNDSITLTGPLTPGGDVNLMTSGAINFNNAVTLATSKNLMANAGGPINLGTTNADLSASGTGAISLLTPRNIALQNGSSITTVDGDLTLNADQQPSATIGAFPGIDLNGAAAHVTGTGTLTVLGRGGIDPGNAQYGIHLGAGGALIAGTGAAGMVSGTGGGGTGVGNHGINVIGSGAIITSDGADLQVSGTGGGSGGSSGNTGISVMSGGQISTGGTGNLTVIGTGGAGTGGGANGVELNGTVGQSSGITSNGGFVNVTGTGGSSGGDSNVGVAVGGETHIFAGGTGNASVTGMGGLTQGHLNIGIHVDGNNASIGAAGGNVLVDGTGGGLAVFAGHNNEGVAITNTARVAGSTTGSVTINGQGGAGTGTDNLGLEFFNNSTIQSGGSITLTATEGGGGAPAMKFLNGGGSIFTTGTGNIALRADSISIGSGVSINASTRTVSLRTFTSGVAIDLGSASDPVGGPLSLSDAELDGVTAGTLIIGDSTTGAVGITAPISRTAPTNFTVTTGGSGDIQFSGTGQLDAAGGNVSLFSNAGIFSGSATVDILCGALSLSAGATGMGSNLNPLSFDASTVATTSNGFAASLFLKEANTVNFSSLSADAGTITLSGGTFVSTVANAINNNTNLALDATLDLNGTNLTFAALTGGASGLITNSALTPSTVTFGGAGGNSIFAGSIQDANGVVSITKIGAGTEIFTGANTYSGATNIAAGTLQIGVGGTTGTLGSGAVSIGGALSINHGDNITIANTLTGTGSLTQAGSGTLTLTGTNTYGATIINAGVLQVGNGGTSGTLGSGSILDNSGLIFNRSDTLTIAADISGGGGILQDGTGMVILSGNNTFTGNTSVDFGGTLRVDTFSSSLNGSLTLTGGTLVYNFSGTHTVQPLVLLGANSTVSVAAGARVDWAGNAMTGASFNFTKAGPGVLSHDDAVWNTKQLFVQAGALAATASGAFGTGAIDVSTGAALWVDAGSATLSNPLTLRGDGSGVSAPGTAYSGALVLTTGSGAATFSGGINLATDTTINASGGNVSLTGVVSGSGGLTKLGASNLILTSKNNSFGLAGSSTITVADGSLQVAADHALGDPGNSLVFATGGGLITTAGFTTPRHFSVANDTTFNVTGTLTLSGTVDGAGVITKTGLGKLVFGTGFTGSTTVSGATGPIAVGGAKVAVTGAGSAVITVAPDGMGGTKIENIALSDTTATTKVVFKAPTTLGSTLLVEHITSANPADEIASITLRKGVILGDGVADGVPEIDLAGRLGKLALDTVVPNALIRLGTGLTYNNPGDDTSPDTYNNHPDVAIKSITGDGVIIDVTGDGMPAGTGGGGLGKVVVTNWAGAGIVRTTQSIGSFTLRNGDCHVVFEVDKLHNGSATVADVGRMVIVHGAWGSSGSEIEGAVGNFSGQAFIAGATITAGNFLHFSVKSGAFAGTVTLTKADDARVGTFVVNGDFTGTVDAAEAIKNVSVKGDFHGSLSAKAIASITAYSFDGSAIGDTFGDPTRLNIITTEGSLGTLKAKAGGITNYDISVATVFNGPNVAKVTGLTPVPVYGLENVTVTAAVINGITSAYSISNAQFYSAGTIGKLTLGATGLPAANLIGSTLLAGADLGDDRALGGAGANADVFASAPIGAISIKGSVSGGSFIGAGVNPGDLILGNLGDTVIGGLASKIAAITVTGTVSADSHFTAGLFKPKPKISNVSINPLLDARFTVG